MCNKRRIGRLWSHKPFLAPSNRSTSIASILARIVVKFTVWDLCLYTMHHLRPSANDPAVDTIFDPTLDLLPRWACTALFAVCYGMLVYTSVDMYYSTTSRRSALSAHRPPHPPTASLEMAAALQLPMDIHLDRRFLEIPLAPVLPAHVCRLRRAARQLTSAHFSGAFGASAVIHDLGMWGLGRGTEFRTVGGFFVLMGIGVILEHGFKGMTGRCVGGFWGWVWVV